MATTDKIQLSVSSTAGSVSLSGYDAESGASEIVIDQSFGANSTNVGLTLALTAANIQSVFLLSDKGCTITTNGTGSADVQTVSITGTPTGGTFPLYFGGEIAAGIPYNATASQVQTALQALSSIGSGNVTCTGGPLPGTAVTCTFSGSKATGLQSLMATGSGGLTGGTSPAVSVAHTTPGTPTNTIVLQPGIPLVWGTSMGYGSNPFTANVSQAYVSCTAAARLQAKILTN